jgi:hypothetical protein
VFRSTLGEPNGFTTVDEQKPDAEVTVLDMRVLSSLLFQNTPDRSPHRSRAPDVLDLRGDAPPLDVDTFDNGGTNVVTDAFARVYAPPLTRSRGARSDGWTRFALPGGLPIVPVFAEQESGRPRPHRSPPRTP